MTDLVLIALLLLLQTVALLLMFTIVLATLRNQGKRIHQMASTLDDLKAAVAAETTVTQSAITLLQGLKAQLDAAIASCDPAQLEALSQQLNSNVSALAAAVQANTPATPDAPATPAS